MSIQRIVKMTFHQDKCDGFEKFFAEIRSQIEDQPGCEGVKLLKDIDNSGIFFTFSTWKDHEALDAYRQTDLFNEVWPRVKEWFAAKAEAWSTEQIK